MNMSLPIVGITLEGFQVFNEPTYIPLDRLTLLFGPNSAGKSSISDALKLYEQLLNIEPRAREIDPSLNLYDLPGETYRSRFSLYEEILPDLIDRHWRRLGGNADELVAEMGIAVVHTVDNSIDDYSIERQFAGETQRKLLIEPSYSQPIILENSWRFVRDESRLAFSYSLKIQSEFVVDYVDTTIRINLQHPFLRSIEKRVDFAAAALAYPKELSFEDGIFTVKAGVFGFHPSGRDINRKGSNWLAYAPLEDLGADPQLRSLLNQTLGELSLLIGHLMDFLNRSKSFLPETVAASRTVPTRADMILSFVDDSIAAPLKGHLPTGNTFYESLARSLISAPSDQKLADGVNRALSDHLFLDQGYRIDASLWTLSSANPKAVAYDEAAEIVELFLRDGYGSRHQFEDVGSGIGYVLPVLCALFDHQHCFIQQPELHLHPALQAAMGDVLIEAVKVAIGVKQILVETHSEHLLLRILKRIRQTHLQVNIAPELKITSDDVCVLYFDPSPDGTTTVKRLRITEDGEFMDRWPRGFFSERDQELLDE